ncbi:hypothetical protein [Hymenobacter negativus]|uniref:Uncharacterized protein n=1 Tax=Hymenobacter negativus TaxID=2795026 RepID=A0ABS3QLP4_9BACT|nr:hypothetical protein [Hymenobacter negativus]MBO2012177.1 hypothetical protein [Hymenobacter negativus]
MIANLHRLRRYNPADSLARPSVRTVAWLTGQSDYRSACLSPAQAAVLRAVATPGWVGLEANFPYNQAALPAGYRPAPLLAASVRNSAQFIAALGSSTFRRACARHLQPLLDATSSRLVLLCGSCGLQLFYAALPWLRVPVGLHIQLVGLGPVCVRHQSHPQVAVAVVQGWRDWLSRSLCRLPCDYRVSAGHLDYAELPELPALFKQLLRH